MTTANIEAYSLLRTSLALFQKPPAELEDQQLQQVLRQARNEYEIENRVLNTTEAASVVISEQELQRSVAEVRGRFASDEDFAAALAANQLTEQAFIKAIFRQCQVEAVMELIGSRVPKVNEVEIGIYYHSHPEKFHFPERRMARHILISINPDYPENTRESARQRLEIIAATLARKPHKFMDLALKNSECPTALNGGDLGTLLPGKLYPELDQALFKLKLGELSGVVETEIGFHLIQCQKIIPAETLSLKKATPAIQQLMQERYKRTCQRTWLASLPKSGS